ncbi:MAG: hypothetical protein HC838_06710 [Spirulinaceae cyanobacterium RM2_2_10]|nr:hypothetical protein [Spirulinaceae cyanobacterium SM2_1_0]NJO19813.1 hypothetical protein [Spirulinaceae cyanobacterium RM2_2_10]
MSAEKWNYQHLFSFHKVTQFVLPEWDEVFEMEELVKRVANQAIASGYAFMALI